MKKEFKSLDNGLVCMKLLFVCVGNSCRSQMAEGLAKSMGFEAASAGTHPAEKVADHAISLLKSKGISTDGMAPSSIDDMEPAAYDRVISMGCGVHCPAIKIDEDWGLEDPVGHSYEVYEQTAAEIERRLLLLINQDS
jgi:arsenate reductase